MFGWIGNILRVNLTQETLDTCPLNPDTARRFIGGRGLNAYTLLKSIPPGIDPLSDQNILCLAPGLLSATPLGLSSRLHVSTLSPYSGIMGDGNAGGSFAHVMKKAGYDQIVISGKAKYPVYLLIDDDRAELKDAGDLWGTSVWETTDRLVERHGKNASIACIGQAGENLVRSASTMVDKYASAARGSGAVWGVMHLKAICIKGSGSVRLADRKRFVALAKADRKFLATDPVQQEVAARFGSLYGVENWFPGYRNFEKELAGEEIPDALRTEAWKAYEIGRVGCRTCHIKCKNAFRIPSGNRKGEVGEALEYECVYCLGTNCGIEDPVAILEMENLADIYGIDVIAIGNTIALAKDLFNRGIITKTDTGGLNLNWTNADAQIELIHKTAFREGFGNLIAEGMYSLAKHIGKDAMDYCYHVKGLGRGVYPPGLFSLAHAVATRGADHLRGRSWASGDNSTEAVLNDLTENGYVSDDPVRSLLIAEKVTTIADSVGRCKGAVNTWTCALPLVWQGTLWGGLANLITAATGISFTPETIEAAADRIQAVERAFNIRQGIAIQHDLLPQKKTVKYSREGEAERTAHFEMVGAYYEAIGYDPDTGIPLKETLNRLEIPEVHDMIHCSAPYSEWDGPRLWPLDRYPGRNKSL